MISIPLSVDMSTGLGILDLEGRQLFRNHGSGPHNAGVLGDTSGDTQIRITSKFPQKSAENEML